MCARAEVCVYICKCEGVGDVGWFKIAVSVAVGGCVTMRNARVLWWEEG